MLKENFEESFLKFCKKNKFEINKEQIKILNLLKKFINPKKKLFKFLSISNEKLCFYLHQC